MGAGTPAVGSCSGRMISTLNTGWARGGLQPETRVGWELPFLQYDFMCKLNIYQAPTKCQELCQSAENLVINKAGEVLVGTKHTNKTLRSFIVMGSGEMQH